MNKKGQGLSLNVIIIAALALIVLVVLIVVFTAKADRGDRIGEDIAENISENNLQVGTGKEIISGKETNNSWLITFHHFDGCGVVDCPNTDNPLAYCIECLKNRISSRINYSTYKFSIEPRYSLNCSDTLIGLKYDNYSINIMMKDVCDAFVRRSGFANEITNENYEGGEESYVAVLPYSLELNSIWKNKKSGDFIRIKDITYYNLGKGVAYVYTSGDCKYIGDSQTNVLRQLFTKKELLDNYVYVTSINDIGMRNEGGEKKNEN